MPAAGGGKESVNRARSLITPNSEIPWTQQKSSPMEGRSQPVGQAQVASGLV